MKLWTILAALCLATASYAQQGTPGSALANRGAVNVADTIPIVPMGTGTLQGVTIPNLQSAILKGLVYNAKGPPFYARGDGVTDDSAAIQACLDAVAPTSNLFGGECHLPLGAYYLSTTLRQSNYTTFSGEGAGTVLFNQGVALAAPQLTNKNPSAYFMQVRDMGFFGGTYGIFYSVSGGNQVGYEHFDNLTFHLQTVANIGTNSGFQVTTFNNVEWDDAPTGIISPAPTNGNVWIGGVSQNHSGPHINFGASEANSFHGTVFQGGGVAGQSTILLASPKAFTLDGVYGEATHPAFLTETGSNGTTTITNSHFTGATSGGGFIPYTFSSDGVLNFGANDWATPSPGPAKMMVTGSNGDQLGSNNQTTFHTSRSRKDVVSSDLTVTTAANNLVTITRTNTSGSTGDVQGLTGTLTINYVGYNSTGIPYAFARKYPVNVYATGAGVMSAVIGSPYGDASTPNSASLAIAVVGTPTAYSLVIGETFSGAPLSGVSGALAAKESVEFDYIATTGSTATLPDYMTASLAF